uniref:DNA helicase n=1 Tax=Chenopodium quinoa TaxID=63459 RepID=A0A803N9H1_CHEQI
MNMQQRPSSEESYCDLLQIWPLYFPQIDLSFRDWRYLLISKLVCFFATPRGQRFVPQVKHEDDTFSLTLNYQKFRKICDLECFFVNLEEYPKEALLCMGAAIHKVSSFQEKSKLDSHGKINIRLHNHPDSLIALKNLKAAYIDRLVSVRGTVVKVSTVKPLELFKSDNLEEGRVPRTVECELSEDLVDDCIPGDVVTVTGIIRQINNYMDLGGGKSKSKYQGLYYLYMESVSVTNSKSQTIPEDSEYPTADTRATEMSDLYSFSPRDLEFIVKFREEHGPDVFRQMIQSICPSIYGHELVKGLGVVFRDADGNVALTATKKVEISTPNAVKHRLFTLAVHFALRLAQRFGYNNLWVESDAINVINTITSHDAGITLALFGGVRKHSMDQNKVPVRGDIHVIIVGDPGLGKSQLLQAAAAVSPRGIYVCGNATTNAGLTVAVVKDRMTSDYAFEAGAVVLADRGLCCIDEFDKMSAEHQQWSNSVSVAKAGLVASLSARTSILAAANPVGGHYNRAKTVNENLKMSSPLLSRFDLVFILVDKPDENMDKRLSEHIMALHSGHGDNSSTVKRHCRASQSIGQIVVSASSESLVSRLRLDPRKDSEFVPLPAPLLRKYIAYARAYVFPKMSRSAAETLQNFYLRLRDRNTSADGTPITARQLESLVRLAEARARVDLRDEITEQDALDVVEIMKESLYDKYLDEHGVIDFARSGGMSQQKEAKRFLSALNKQSELDQKDCFSISEIYGLADRIGLRVPDIDVFVENLNTVGFLIKKGPRTYQ